MKKIIKKTPISLGGKDFFEILIEDDSMGDNCPCNLCFYSKYPYGDFDLEPSCSDIHGCTMDGNRYCLIEPILTNK